MAAERGVKLGIKAVIYRNTAGYGSPSWAAMTSVRDLTVTPPWDMVEANTRASRVKLWAKTMLDLGFQVSVRKDDASTDAVALLQASMTDDVTDFLVLDGPITTEGSTGFRAHMLVNLSTEDQGANAVIYDTYDLKPGFSEDGTPKYVTIGASSAITATNPGESPS